METVPADDATTDQRLAQRLKALRGERGWSLEELAGRSGVSRATLSRIENAEVSPTASVLGRLCAVYGLTMSRLLHLVEEGFTPLVRRGAQTVWSDPKTSFRRRSVSPPARALAGEAIEGALKAGTEIVYETTPRPGLEHHLVLLEGRLRITVGGQRHELKAGDCLRYQLYDPSAFSTPEDSDARYLLFMV